jgi:hypothetical protein
VRSRGGPSYRPLEWGTASGDPGSRVVTAHGQSLFTGSEISGPHGGWPEVAGRVDALVSTSSIMVLWDGDPEPVEVSPDHVTWVSNPFSTSRVF